MSPIDWHYWNIFLRDVADAVAELGSPSIIWYRGVSSDAHTLLPSLLRYPNGPAKERTLFERYTQIAVRIDRAVTGNRTDWDTLFEMQHYGVPTRLLDWSEVFGVAIFFATLAGSGDRFVYVLNPLALNNQFGKTDLIGEWDRASFGYRAVFWEGNPFKPSTPLALNPNYTSPRLAAQKGRFTIHGVNLAPLEITSPECVRKIKLSADAIPAAMAFLEMAGINEFSVFPDVGGAAPYLKNIVGLA